MKIIGILAITMMASAAPAENRWAIYHNERFGFEACYPPALLVAGPEGGSGDGRTFKSRDGAELRAFGEFFYDDNRSLATRARSLERELIKRGGAVTYRVNRPKWFVLSGTTGTSVFYRKVYSTGASLVDLDLTYPKVAAGTWAPIATRMSRCFPTGSSRD